MYMHPETLDGADAGSRVDQFGWALTTRALTGSNPRTNDPLLFKPLPPSARRSRRSAPCASVLAALSIDPQRRMTSMGLPFDEFEAADRCCMPHASTVTRRRRSVGSADDGPAKRLRST